MTSTMRKTILSFTALTVMAVAPAFAEDAAFTDAQKDAIGPLVKEYLMENPSVIMEAMSAYQNKQREEAQKLAEQKIAENIAKLTSANMPAVGNPDADITIVEFFDYNCGYCKRALPDIQAALEADENVRVVFQEMPILGPSSKAAALWALAAHRQDKYFDYHIALMEHNGPKEERQLEKLAKELGLDVDKMKKDIADGSVEKELDAVMDVAREIGVSGTPAFIVGKSFIPGYVGEQGLKDAIKAERESMKEGG